jgi:co-chaperonin GroES (HSP10)
MILTPELEDVGRRTRVLRDRVLVKPLPYVHPQLITPGIETNKGVVIAVGYGRRERRKVRFDAAASHLATSKSVYFEDGDELGRIIPMQVKPGDVVEFSFRNVTVVDFDRVGFPGIGQLGFVWQNAIYSIDPDESLNECLLWQQSAGYDRQGNYMSGANWNKA